MPPAALTTRLASRFCPLTSFYSKILTHFPATLLIPKDQGEGWNWPCSSIPVDVPRLCGLAPIWPLTLEQYHRMIEAGVVGEDDPVELIDGYLVYKDQGRGPGMGHGLPHASSVRQAQIILQAVLGTKWVVQSQLPVTLGASTSAGGPKGEGDA